MHFKYCQILAQSLLWCELASILLQNVASFLWHLKKAYVVGTVTAIGPRGQVEARHLNIIDKVWDYNTHAGGSWFEL